MKRVTLAVVALCAAAAVLLSLSLRGVTMRPGWLPWVVTPGAEPIPSTPSIDAADVGLLVRTILLAAGALIIVVAVLNLFSKEGRRRVLVYAATAAVVLLCFFLLSLLLPGVQPVEKDPVTLPSTEPQAVPGSVASLTDPSRRTPPWLLDAVLAAAVLAAAGAAAGVAAAVRSRGRRPAWADLAEKARAAVDALSRGGELPDVILRCYRDMLDVIDRARGLARPAAATPAEFAAELVAAGLPPGPVRELTAVFEDVRYGGTAPTAEAEMRALRSLEAISRFCEEAA